MLLKTGALVLFKAHNQQISNHGVLMQCVIRWWKKQISSLLHLEFIGLRNTSILMCATQGSCSFQLPSFCSLFNSN